jgi:branched-chain amino acid transport system permease protein
MTQLNQQSILGAAYASSGYKWSTRFLLVFLLGFVIIFPIIEKSPSHQNFVILVLMAAQLGVAWNIIGGYAGQVSLGQAAFYGLGAYTSTLLFTKFGINP